MDILTEPRGREILLPVWLGSSQLRENFDYLRPAKYLLFFEVARYGNIFSSGMAGMPDDWISQGIRSELLYYMRDRSFFGIDSNCLQWILDLKSYNSWLKFFAEELATKYVATSMSFWHICALAERSGTSTGRKSGRERECSPTHFGSLFFLRRAAMDRREHHRSRYRPFDLGFSALIWRLYKRMKSRKP